MSTDAPHPALIHPDVAAALADGRGVVALETTIVVHGLPAPINLNVAQACEDAVRASGSVPATIAVIDGVVRVGLDRDELADFADAAHNVTKLSARDLGFAIGAGRSGATTVAGTIAVAHQVGIAVMATGGLGGVHRGALETFDESHDLTALSRTPVLVVASGVKSILDIGATLERLDTLGVAVCAYGSDWFPSFYLSASAHRVDWRIDTAAAAAAAFRAHRQWSSTGFVVAHPVASDRQLDAELHDRALAGALAEVAALGVRGKDVTPAVLSAFARLTGGASVDVNRDLVVANARVAGEIARELARGS